MNEITRIHLAGVAYEIDLNAKKELEKYLLAIKKSLGPDADAMEDIEIRMTEILAERGTIKDSVITEYDLKAIRERLGEPKDFSSESDRHTTEKSETISDKINQAFADKKFYRDPENAILGGVIAGLSAYTGWDVTLLRLLAALLVFISAGFFIIAYIVVWIVAPEARTTSEKLAMQGKPVNIDSIKQSAKEFSEKAKETGKTTSEKAKKSSKVVAEKIEHTAKRAVDKTASAGFVLGRIFSVFFGIIGLIVSLSLIMSLAPATVLVVRTFIDFSIPLLPLAIVTATTGGFAFLFFIIFGITLSISMITGAINNGRKKIGLTSLIIVAVVFFTAAIVLGTVWASINGIDSVEFSINAFRENFHHIRHFPMFSLPY